MIEEQVHTSGLLTWVGHATVLIELDGTRLITDPLLRGRVAHLRRHGPPPSPAATQRLDAVLVSHLHRDHLDLPSLRRIARRTRLIVPRGAGALLRRAGFTRAEQIEVGQARSVGAVEVVAVPAQHDGRRRPLGGPVAEAIGFVVRGASSIYFAGDTDLHPGMAELAGNDVALLPVWGWGPTLGEGHLDPERAAQATALLRPRLVVPIHWGTFYPIGLARRRPAPLRDPPLRFAGRVAELAPEVDVEILQPGASMPLYDWPGG